MVSMAAPWKHPDTGVYYLRKGIPKDVRHVFSGKTVFKKSLGTRDGKKAKELFLPELQRVERLLAMATDGTIRFTPKQARGLAGMWLQKALDEDETYRETEGIPEGDHEDNPYEAELRYIEEMKTLKQREVFILDDINSTLEDSGLILPSKTSEGYKNLIREFLAAKHEYFRILQGRVGNRWVNVDLSQRYPVFEPPKKKSVKPKVITKGTSLESLLKDYRAEGIITAKTADDYLVSIAHFEKVVGVLPIEGIMVEHIRAFRDALVAMGDKLASATKTRKIGAIKSLLAYAIDKGLIDGNPAANIKIRNKESKLGSKLPFTQEDVRHIFSSKVFTDNYRPKAGMGEAAYWLPYLALYTGARLEEMGQLRVDDIQEHEGIPFIEFTTDMDEVGSTRSIKTKAGKRIVPLHPSLIELGFLDYVAKQKKAKRTQLFHLFVKDKYGDYTQKWSKWFNQRYLREELKITDKKKSFHSFRHTFVGTCRSIGMPEDIQNALVGHEGDKKVSLGYGRWQSPRGGTYAFNPEVLFKEMSKLELIG